VACGTGDLTLLLAEQRARVAGVDFTPQMLLHAVPKDRRRRTLFARGDALALPAADGSVELTTIAFGLRNLADRQGGLAELRRVLAPGGAALVLEFTLPPGPLLGALYRFYFTRVLPRLGGAVSGDKGAYTYLPDTVLAWPGPAELESEMGAVGFVEVGHELLTGGIAALHWGRAPGAPAGGS
jgi:demethylmenaquinone methyltransferase / 2-methoxy-6-polyprenyl-1,4-benzoquinol methylase